MEQVLIVDRSALFAGVWPQGFTPIPDAATFVTRLESIARFEARPHAEETPAWKQLIPYVVVTRGRRDVFCVERLPTQGEARLHGKLSIGIGGHVEPIDGPIPGILARAAARELHEELILPPHPAPRLCGLINDDSNPVGAVHAGLALWVELPDDCPEESLAVREISKMRGGLRGLVDPSGVWQDAARLESWSALLLDAFLRPMGTSTSSALEGSHPSLPPEEQQHG